jgi:hypothetical protein
MILALIVPAGLAACATADETIAGDPQGTRDRQKERGVSMARAGCEPAGFSFSVCWRGAPSISVGVPSSLSENELRSLRNVADEWNRLLQEGSTFGSPRLSVSTATTGNVVVTFPQGKSGSVYCGDVIGSGQSYTMRLFPSTSSTCDGRVSGPLADAFRHEITGPIGWDDTAEGLAQAGVSDHCSLYISDASPFFKSQVCLHEVEGVFRAYRSVGVPSDFWSRGILRRTTLDTASITLLPGQTRQLSLTALVSEPPASYNLTQPSGPDSLLFSSSSTSTATVSAGGLVTAIAAPNLATIRVRARQDRVPSNRLVWSPLEQIGDAKRVSVRFDSLLRVTNITSPGAPPFTTSGNKTFTASIAGAAPSPAVQVVWQADFSDNGIGWDVTQTTGTSFTMLVPEGSYSIEIRATPKQGTNTGAAYQSQWPVCTPMNFLRLPAPQAPQPMAPQGC